MTVIVEPIKGVEIRIRAVIYVRISSRNQDIENSSSAQIAAGKAFIEKMGGWVLVGIYIDKARSGRDDERPQHSLMVLDGRRPDREFDKVVVWKMDRYARDETHASLTKAMLRKAGVDVVSVTEPAAEGKFGRIYEVILDLMAEIYSEGISENVKRGTRNLAKQGYFLGTHAPYGYKIQKVQVGDKYHQKLEIDPETSKIAREIFDFLLAGKSLSYINRDFHARGILSPKGNPTWPPGTFHRIAHNLHYTGTIVWSAGTEDEEGAVYCPDAHPAIVNKDEFDKIQELLAAKHYKPKESGEDEDAGNNPREDGGKYLLSGIITCELCEAKMYPKPGKDGNYGYYCCKTRLDFKEKGCYCPNRNSFDLDKRVMNAVMNEILSDINITHLIDQIRADTDQSNVDYAQLMSDLDKGLAQIGRRQDRALQVFELDTITQEKYLERMIEVKEEEQRLEKEKATAEAIMGDEITILTDLKSVEDYATQVRGFLETVDPSEWKPIIRKFVRNVSVGYEQGIITYKIPCRTTTPSPAE